MEAQEAKFHIPLYHVLRAKCVLEKLLSVCRVKAIPKQSCRAWSEGLQSGVDEVWDSAPLELIPFQNLSRLSHLFKIYIKTGKRYLNIHLGLI